MSPQQTIPETISMEASTPIETASADLTETDNALETDNAAETDNATETYHATEMDNAAETNMPGNAAPEPSEIKAANVSHTGRLRVNVTSSAGLFPIVNATITIYDAKDPENLLETLTTSISGQTDIAELPAPCPDWSLLPSEEQPYSEYNIHVAAEGYAPVRIFHSELLPNVLSIQNITMNPLTGRNAEEAKVVPIDPHTLFHEYPARIVEEEIKPMAETGDSVLSRVVIPEFIIVHDGVPSDPAARNYWVRYKDYIKNVVSCEIYPTWSEAAIYANILTIMSFTMNRVYTEWYRNQGYEFTITSSTAHDQKWIYGHNIYENVDYLVDRVFASYLSRPGVKQPILTSHCDGKRFRCDGLNQWDSQALSEEGYSAIEIIRYFFGDDMYMNTAQVISGVPSAWPGYNLTIGAAGDNVKQMQTQLNRIARNYQVLPFISADGIYGQKTAEDVNTFQSIFNLPQTGITDYATWYGISEIYAASSRNI